MQKFLEQYAQVPQRQRYAGVALIAVAFIALYYYFIHQDNSRRVERMEGQLRKLSAELAEKQAYIDNLARYEARLNELQTALNAARAQLPDEADVAQLLAQLSNNARQAGLTIEKFEPKAEATQEFFAELPFEMQVRGTYHEIASFIDAIGHMDRIVNVSGISMNNPKSENQKAVVDGQFNIKGFRFIDKETK